MSYGVTLVSFRNGRQDSIPRDSIISVLTRHGCLIPELREGSNEIGLPHEQPYYSPLGEFAIITVKDGAVTAFGLHRPQATAQCRALLSSLIDQMGLSMFPDFGIDLFAREDIFDEIPEDVLAQFSNLILVRRPEDCA